jgi:hypothetical protein
MDPPAAHRSPASTTRGRAIVDRARSYVDRIPGAVSGQGGHHHTYRVALALVKGFELNEGTAFVLLAEWNGTCAPPWSERELVHKIRSATASRDVGSGYLLERGAA